jgi:hypothetical protein
MAMSSSIRLRRSPNPGAFTATPVKVPRSLLTTSVASGDHDQRLAALHHLLQQGQEVTHGADLLVRDQDVWLVEHGLHAVLVGDHVRGDVALVELHPLRELQLHAEGLALLDVHDAVLADLLDRVRDHVADLVVGGRDRGNPSDLVLAGDLPRLLVAQVLDHLLDGLLDAAPQRQRVGACGDVPETRAHHRLGQQGGGGGPVAGHVVGSRGDLAHQLGALVLEHVLDLDLACDRDAVVGDRRGAELLVEHHIAPLRAEGHLDRIRDRVNAVLKRGPRLDVVLELLVSHLSSFLLLLSHCDRPQAADRLSVGI